MTPTQLAQFALDFHGWYTGKEKSELKPCIENIEAFAKRWKQDQPQPAEQSKTKDDVLLEILAPLGTETPDPTEEYADLFAYLYDNISPLLSNPKQSAEPVRCCYCGEECHPAYHTDWGIVCGKHCLSNPFTAGQSIAKEKWDRLNRGITEFEAEQPQPAEPRLTAEEFKALHTNMGVLNLMEQYAQHKVAFAVAARDVEWNTAKSCVQELMYNKANQELKSKIQNRIDDLKERMFTEKDKCGKSDYYQFMKLAKKELESLLKS